MAALGEQVFEVLDKHNKGVIGPDELQEVVQQDGMESSEEDVLQLLQGIDIDGSNSLNYREFLAATMEASRGLASLNRFVNPSCM